MNTEQGKSTPPLMAESIERYVQVAEIATETPDFDTAVPLHYAEQTRPTFEGHLLM